MSLAAQGFSYGIIGGIQLLTDWACFVGLTWLGVHTVTANITGRVLGALFGFWLNGRGTFAAEIDGKLLPRHFLRFMVSWTTMTIASTLILSLVNRSSGLHLAWVVKPFADGILAISGFLISKYWIYK
ncbi:MAG: GtrA family protein [Paraburkholderia sp.]|uniref:GtrA family protein n=1 Tax=Paraburkholderia sp. TaxID=1926495 RepID=UPI0011F8E530|nr:GtrA family protein [Paraburkholderia sp.]TAL97275.1 MAG: GtrA family protein [Paraburkholderia sp.]